MHTKTDESSFGDALRALRLKREKGLREFARELNISSGYYSLIEYGKRPPLKDPVLKRALRLLEPTYEEAQMLIDSAVLTRLQFQFRKKNVDWKGAIHLISYEPFSEFFDGHPPPPKRLSRYPSQAKIVIPKVTQHDYDKLEAAGSDSLQKIFRQAIESVESPVITVIYNRTDEVLTFIWEGEVGRNQRVLEIEKVQ